MASAYDIWLSAPYCDQKDDRIYAYEQKAKDDIRRELMDDDVFAAEAALHCHSSINSLYYISKAARGSHDAEYARAVSHEITYDDQTDDEKYVIAAKDGQHDTALAAKIKADLVEHIVEIRWAGLAGLMAEWNGQEAA